MKKQNITKFTDRYIGKKVYNYLKELYLKLGTKEEDVEFMILHDRSFILEQKKDQLRSFIFDCIEQDELDNPVELFSYFHKIKSITLPNSITSIGQNAFFGCSNITGELTLPENMRLPV